MGLEWVAREVGLDVNAFVQPFLNHTAVCLCVAAFVVIWAAAAAAFVVVLAVVLAAVWAALNLFPPLRLFFQYLPATLGVVGEYISRRVSLRFRFPLRMCVNGWGGTYVIRHLWFVCLLIAL
jgi:hypothetical protein